MNIISDLRMLMGKKHVINEYHATLTSPLANGIVERSVEFTNSLPNRREEAIHYAGSHKRFECNGSTAPRGGA